MTNLRVRVEQRYQCWCVLVDSDGSENPCKQETTGPDDPFCDTCTDRHPFLGVTVTERDPRQY